MQRAYFYYCLNDLFGVIFAVLYSEHTGLSGARMNATMLPTVHPCDFAGFLLAKGHFSGDNLPLCETKREAKAKNRESGAL